MGAQPHYFPAPDDAWLIAAGLDPTIHPQSIFIAEFFDRKGMHDVSKALIEYNLNLIKAFTLEERFAQFGLQIKSQTGGCYDGYFHEYEPRTLELSNNLILQEVRDEEAEQAKYKDRLYTSGYDFVFCYRVQVK